MCEHIKHATMVALKIVFYERRTNWDGTHVTWEGACMGREAHHTISGHLSSIAAQDAKVQTVPANEAWSP